MRALIVDDEVHARDELEALLEEVGELQVVGKCANALEALQAIKREKPGVIFLDIQMPVIGGFELLSMMDEETMPRVVFVTAYDEYALKAFEENALDYLLKPVEKPRLAKTIQRLRKTTASADRPSLPLVEIKRIPCMSVNRIKLVPALEVEYARSDIAGVYIVTAQGELYTDLTLKVLEKRAAFVRCHKQFLVNMDQVDEIVLSENSAAMITTRSGRAVPVSRRYLRKMKEILGLHATHHA